MVGDIDVLSILCAYQTVCIAVRDGIVGTVRRGATREGGFGDIGESVLRGVGTDGWNSVLNTWGLR